MIKPIMKDPLFLSRKSAPATKADLSIGKDLLDTLISHQHECVGMAANMIGEAKNIIAVNADGLYLVMYNPEIISKSEPYAAEEGCLSLSGVRPTTRYSKITVRYQTQNFKVVTADFSGFTAQIIQHEYDHLQGILI